MDKVWNTLVDTYKSNIDKNDKKQSEKFIKNLNKVINNYNTEYMDSDYDNYENTINENKIKKNGKVTFRNK